MKHLLFVLATLTIFSNAYATPASGEVVYLKSGKCGITLDYNRTYPHSATVTFHAYKDYSCKYDGYKYSLHRKKLSADGLQIRFTSIPGSGFSNFDCTSAGSYGTGFRLECSDGNVYFGELVD